MKDGIIQRIDLHYREGSSDKIYQMVIVPDESSAGANRRVKLVTAYGKASSAERGRFQSVSEVSLPLSSAESMLRGKAREKMAKGYEEVGPLTYTALGEGEIWRTGDLKNAKPAKEKPSAPKTSEKPIKVISLDF